MNFIKRYLFKKDIKSAEKHKRYLNSIFRENLQNMKTFTTNRQGAVFKS